MITPGWKNSKKQLPHIGKDVLVCIPSNSEKPFYVAKIVEFNGKQTWCASNTVRNLFFSLKDVTRWISIPLFRGFEYNVEKAEKMLPFNSDYRFELIDFEE